jgi:H+/Na+-translocating ferredoxin:NAD+ oxidoreductase subunit G
VREIIKMIVVLSVLSLLSGGLLAAIHNQTKEQAQLQLIKYVKGPALRKIFQNASNNPITSRLEITEGKTSRDVFVGVLDGEPRGVAFETFGKGGYGGYVGLMVAVDVKDDKLIGVAVTSHSETPGMGARAETDTDFTGQFQGLPVKEEPFKVRQDGGNIDALSGATLTSRAVCLATTEAAEIYEQIKPEVEEKLKEFKQ